MLYDLNIPWSPTLDPSQLQRTISFASSLGYTTLALNHSLTSIPKEIHNPIPLTLPFALPPNVTILRRCTICPDNPTQNYRLSLLASAYDILALRATTLKDFEAACLSIGDHSILSLDLTQSFQFYFKPKPLMTAINRGCRIELCYSQAMVGDASKRRNFISNTMAIMRCTKGRGLLISSEAQDVLGLRAPADVVNLFAVWGLGRERGMEGLSVVARGVVVNEGLKRSSFRGVVDVIDGGERSVEATKAVEAAKVTAKEGKRKAVEVKVDGTPQISKRELKRRRLAAKAEEKESLTKEDAMVATKPMSSISGVPGPTVSSTIKPP